MSGAAGLSAAKRRRGVQASTFASGVVEEPPLPESPALPVHPMQQLQIHEHKLNGLLAHIQALGEAFVEHRTEVALAIPQLQEAVEELLRAAQLDTQFTNSAVADTQEEEEEDDTGTVEEGSQDGQAQRLMMSITNELHQRLSEEAEAKKRLEGKLEQVARDHADTQARLSGTEAEVRQLKEQLAQSRKKAQNDRRDPTFPSKSDADIVKEALSKASEGNVALHTIEEGA